MNLAKVGDKNLITLTLDVYNLLGLDILSSRRKYMMLHRSFPPTLNAGGEVQASNSSNVNTPYSSALELLSEPDLRDNSQEYAHAVKDIR